MFKSLIIVFFIFISAGNLKAQAPSLRDIPLLDKTWEMIGQKSFKKIANGKEIPVFPAPLQAMNNKNTDLSGYMVPIKMGATHNIFMLSVLPTAQCQFCGTNGIPDMVEIHLSEAIPYTNDPITIVGKLVIKTADEFSSNVFLLDAKLYK
jgi:hypothetical protein